MRYFFDESGNWQEIIDENKRLVIAGMVILDEEIFKDLELNLKFFMRENNLTQIHATDIKKWELKLKLWEFFYNYIKLDDIKVLAYIINPQSLFQSKKEADEIYIEIASSLIGEISFGDEFIDIEYDMKFHYAYSTKVLESMNIKRDYNDDFFRMSKNFYLTNFAYEKQKKRVLNLLKKRNPFSSYMEIEKFINSKKNISRYLWEEFRLKVEKTALIKELFKEKINNFIKTNCQMLGIDFYEPTIRINYKNKFQQSGGVQMIDVINNIIYYNGLKPLENQPEIIKNIYKHIELKEIK